MSLLRRPVASGVPPELRPRVWLLLAAARLPDMLAHSTCGDAGASYYARLARPLDRGAGGGTGGGGGGAGAGGGAGGSAGGGGGGGESAGMVAAAEQIELDLPRTFPAQAELRTPRGRVRLRPEPDPNPGPRP